MSMHYDLSEYVSGGYFVALATERPSYMNADLLPPRIVSASQCICRFFPDSWAIEWASDSPEERAEAAAAFGITAEQYPQVKHWATNAFEHEFGWPRLFYTLDFAASGLKLIPTPVPGLVIFSLALHHTLVEDFLRV